MEKNKVVKIKEIKMISWIRYEEYSFEMRINYVTKSDVSDIVKELIELNELKYNIKIEENRNGSIGGFNNEMLYLIIVRRHGEVNKKCYEWYEKVKEIIERLREKENNRWREKREEKENNRFNWMK
jgi:hypothetical protein